MKPGSSEGSQLYLCAGGDSLIEDGPVSESVGEANRLFAGVDAVHVCRLTTTGYKGSEVRGQRVQFTRMSNQGAESYLGNNLLSSP